LLHGICEFTERIGNLHAHSKGLETFGDDQHIIRPRPRPRPLTRHCAPCASPFTVFTPFTAFAAFAAFAAFTAFTAFTRVVRLYRPPYGSGATGERTDLDRIPVRRDERKRW
jgi:hypothetical protein